MPPRSSLISQIVQATVDYQLWRDQGSLLSFHLVNIPLLAWLLVALSSLLVVVVNEAVKLHEIRYDGGHESVYPFSDANGFVIYK